MVDDSVARMRQNDRFVLDQDCLSWTAPVHSDDEDDDAFDGQVSSTFTFFSVISSLDWRHYEPTQMCLGPWQLQCPVVLFHHFNGHFPGGPALAGTSLKVIVK